MTDDTKEYPRPPTQEEMDKFIDKFIGVAWLMGEGDITSDYRDSMPDLPETRGVRHMDWSYDEMKRRREGDN